MATPRLPPLQRGDLVALKKGAHYDTALGVVTRVSGVRLRVTFGDGLEWVFSPATGRSMNTAKSSLGYHVRALDAATRQDMLACGLGIMPCSRRQLDTMEQRGRALRDAIVGAAPPEAAPAPEAGPPADRPPGPRR